MSDPRDEEYRGSSGPMAMGIALLLIVVSFLWEASKQ